MTLLQRHKLYKETIKGNNINIFLKKESTKKNVGLKLRVLSMKDNNEQTNFKRKTFYAESLPVSYTHLTLPTICSV